MVKRKVNEGLDQRVEGNSGKKENKKDKEAAKETETAVEFNMDYKVEEENMEMPNT